MTESTEVAGDLERKGLTAELLRTLVRYEPETGIFYRLAAPKRAAGKALGKPAAAYLNDNGYALVSLGRKWRFRVHQLAWLYMAGRWPVADIDHINGIRDDNRWANLRAATRAQNIANSRTPHDSLTGIKGVSFETARGKWRAQLGINGCPKFLGRFDSKEEAAKAYERALTARFGEFARTA